MAETEGEGIMEGNKLCLEALSKIPKRFIDNETRYTTWVNMKRVYIANPKYTPMYYEKGKWRFIRFKKEMTASEIIVGRLTNVPMPIFKRRN
jgi:hypothetical protein